MNVLKEEKTKSRVVHVLTESRVEIRTQKLSPFKKCTKYDENVPTQKPSERGLMHKEGSHRDVEGGGTSRPEFRVSGASSLTHRPTTQLTSVT